MSINTITPSWLYKEDGTYIAPRTLTSCIQDEDGNSFQEYADKMIIMSDEETVSMNEDLVTNITNKDIQNIVSDAYDNSKTYAINDYCIKDNILYKCNTTIETAEEFDSSKWTSTNVAKEISDLSDKTLKIKSVTITGTTDGYGNFALSTIVPYYNLSIINVCCISHSEILCSPFVASASWWYARLTQNSNSYVPLANTTVTITYKCLSY